MWAPSSFSDLRSSSSLLSSQTRRLFWFGFSDMSWVLWTIRNKFTIENIFPAKPADCMFKLIFFLQQWKPLIKEQDPGATKASTASSFLRSNRASTSWVSLFWYCCPWGVGRRPACRSRLLCLVTVLLNIWAFGRLSCAGVCYWVLSIGFICNVGHQPFLYKKIDYRPFTASVLKKAHVKLFMDETNHMELSYTCHCDVNQDMVWLTSDVPRQIPRQLTKTCHCEL